ncbi:SDR family NAD(P)-dependent oxidoreductase [Methylophaga sp.]|uniref:SDR family NAD(P)-dependent oxidoreductase n=1 Tax=Methylophaga sp. TaxID=2024840 RepID=UPI003F6A1A5C
MQHPAEGDQLNDHIILITGAARGIGASVAKACAAQGATVILLDKQLKLLEKVYDEVEQAGFSTPAIYPLDLKGASEPDYQQLATSISDNFGRLDAVIHCAATLGQLAPVEHQDTQTWLETLHINLTAAVLLTKACLPLLKKQQSSTLIFTTDSHSHKAYWGAYGISKAATEAFAAQLSDELEAQAHVAVHCIDPGDTKTELFARAFPAKDPTELPEADEIALQYLNLLCDQGHRQTR